MKAVKQIPWLFLAFLFIAGIGYLVIISGPNNAAFLYAGLSFIAVSLIPLAWVVSFLVRYFKKV